MAKKFTQKRDANQGTSSISKLNDPESVDGSAPASVQSSQISGTVVRIVATTGPLYFNIGADPTAASSGDNLGHYLADQQEVYQPCNENDKVAIYGGIAQVSTVGE